MDGVLRSHGLPLLFLLGPAAVDLALGPEQVILGLVAASPLVAATLTGRRTTGAYGVLAVLTAALLGAYDRQYEGDAVPAQLVRLALVTAAALVALGACTLRVRREADLQRLSAEAASARASLALGETLQRHLLGPPPVVPGLASAARYLPALRGTRVGGDWYDAFPAAGGGTVLVIGDVAGHDPQAAAAMAEVRGMLRAVAVDATSPAGLLGALDRVMAHPAAPAMVTGVVAMVEPAGDGARLRWSNAGHPPPALVRADGSVRLLERDPERALGVTAGAPRTDAELVLRPGDSLLLYTDGLVERRGGSLDDGNAWLVGELGRHAADPLDELCDRLLAGVGGAARHDDVALLAVRVPGPGSPARARRTVRR
ncbi:PP2C family protein-serine/threonine phosphatase [Geodermatophilus nigrescens]|uniref:Serine phosphatase RsbU, regulator of sigma subunit n=1 Tax=Geodermatophilus nigrescens TaxID=1070870 RepID=A0A1M5QFI1_9ACTN|nr:PP2C family protein-serine/threonine phosphatase [Geodermatophilus nigrescens]SHH12606.1 Serine phosphatase RsbU, regulator of sigma subunit [Geodermatophilus nigrescens]